MLFISHCRWILLLFVVALILPTSLLSAKLDTALRTATWGGSCEPGWQNIIAGCNLVLTLYNDTDKSEQPLEPGWPEGYTVEAALDFRNGEVYIPTPGLIDRLEPTHYISMVNRTYESGMLHSPEQGIDHEAVNAKSFAMHIPPELIGHTLTFRGQYNHRGHDIVSATTRSIEVIAPCDEFDQAKIVSSWIYVASQSLDYDRAIQLADSMLESGLTDLEGWHFAKVAAQGSGRIDKYMNYLERMWEDFGRVDTNFGTGEPPPRFNHDARDPSLQRYYESTMENLRQQLAEQEQQED